MSLERTEPEPILDSRLIVATNKIPYNVKLVDCGDYCQLYMYESKKTKTRKKDDKSDLELTKFKTDEIENKPASEKKPTEVKLNNSIESKNIIRSKLECQRLAKSNIKDWETFITLTFAENVSNIDFANKRLKYFIDKVRKVKKDLKYLIIPEFQKRGAVHYHMLSNISLNDSSLIFVQEDNLKYKHIKYWNDGFTSVEIMKGDVKKIIGYISKYMTKDIDNRLFSHHRYLYSRNLSMPKVSYVNLDNKKDLEFYKKRIQDKNLIYQNEYINPYDNQKVTFLEFLKN